MICLVVNTKYGNFMPLENTPTSSRVYNSQEQSEIYSPLLYRARLLTELIKKGNFFLLGSLVFGSANNLLENKDDKKNILGLTASKSCMIGIC